MKSFAECPQLDVFKSSLVKDAHFSRVYELPLVSKTDFVPSEGVPLSLSTRTQNYNQWLHFYEHDYQFEKVWKEPTKYLPLFKKFQGVITPDYSLYREMPIVMQMWNTYRNRAIAYWLQSKGVNIIMNVRWGDERTYDFAFEGLQQGGTYAVCTNGCIRNKLDRYYFKKGLAKMVEQLRPDTIVNYSSKAKDIFAPYLAQGIEVITLNYWRDAFRKLGN